eukprot:UC1_evm7s297
MPEGPELLYMGEHITKMACGRVYTKVTRSDVAVHPRKHPAFQIKWPRFTLRAEARGKEVRLVISPLDYTAPTAGNGSGGRTTRRGRHRRHDNLKRSSGTCGDGEMEMPLVLHLRFRMGMTGNWYRAEPGEALRPHSHLCFHDTKGGVLCFTDSRRFGSWEVAECWGEDRGPCVLTEHTAFRQHLLALLGSRNHARTMERPICELMLDQRVFHGIGNYLRAEILHRAGVHPFTRARDVLEHALGKEEVVGNEQDGAPKIRADDVVSLCKTVCAESLTLLRRHGFEHDEQRLQAFRDWLQCYMKLDKTLDANKRTIWFSKKTPKWNKNNKNKNKRTDSKSRSAQESGTGKTIKVEETTMVVERRESRVHRASRTAHVEAVVTPKRASSSSHHKASRTYVHAAPAMRRALRKRSATTATATAVTVAEVTVTSSIHEADPVCDTMSGSSARRRLRFSKIKMKKEEANAKANAKADITPIARRVSKRKRVMASKA